jgi:nucleoside-diphosphate-sugar epimerase
VYEMTKLILSQQFIPIIGEGQARWNNVHVADLSEVFLLLIDAAVNQRLDEGLWGEKGYYLVENGEHLWSDLAARVGAQAEKLGLAKGLEKRSLSEEAALEAAGFEAVSWGLNSRGKAQRARKLLGWEPKALSIEDTVPEIVKNESERLKGAK